jgi:tetratricopeptide (TPR) repeat protein
MRSHTSVSTLQLDITPAQLFRALRTLALCFAFHTTRVHAQTEGGPQQDSVPPAYQSAAELGFKEFSLQNYPEARKRFQEAADIYPNARISRALGMVEYELRHYQAARAHLARATKELLASAVSYLAHYRIDVEPRGASLRLDGLPVLSPPEGTLVLQAGDHIIEAEHAGFWPVRRELHVRGGETLDVQLRLLQRTQADPPTRLYESPWLWVGTGALAVGAVVTLFFVLRPEAETRVGEPVVTSSTPPGVVILALGSQ